MVLLDNRDTIYLPVFTPCDPIVGKENSIVRVTQITYKFVEALPLDVNFTVYELFLRLFFNDSLKNCFQSIYNNLEGKSIFQDSFTIGFVSIISFLIRQ